MEQLKLLLRDQQREVNIDVIKACKTFKDALKLCKSITGLDDKQICLALDIDPGHWSKIFTNGGHFPENKLVDFMELCGNKIPLIWLSYTCGYTLAPLKSELEMELERERQEKEEFKKKYEYAIEALRAVKS